MGQNGTQALDVICFQEVVVFETLVSLKSQATIEATNSIVDTETRWMLTY